MSKPSLFSHFKVSCAGRVGGQIRSIGKRQLATVSCRQIGDDAGAYSETNNPNPEAPGATHPTHATQRLTSLR